MALPDLEKLSVMTLQGRPLLELGSPGEAFHSPSSPEEDPPKTSSVEKGSDLNCKINASVIFLRGKVISSLLKYFLITYSSLEG